MVKENYDFVRYFVEFRMRTRMTRLKVKKKIKTNKSNGFRFKSKPMFSLALTRFRMYVNVRWFLVTGKRLRGSTRKLNSIRIEREKRFQFCTRILVKSCVLI